MFCTCLKVGKSIMIGEAKVTFLKLDKKEVRLGIDADKSIKIEHERKDAHKLKQDA